VTWKIQWKCDKKSVESENRNYARVRKAALLGEMASMDWDDMLRGDSLECWSNFCQYLEQLENRYVPMKRP